MFLQLLLIALAFYQTIMYLRNRTYAMLVYDEHTLNNMANEQSTDDGSTATHNNDNDPSVTLSAIRIMPQNAWWRAQQTAMSIMANTSSSDVLRADIMKRQHDGLIIVHPLEWYVYYRPGNHFYYITNTFSKSIACAPTECSVLIMEPRDQITIDQSRRSNDNDNDDREPSSTPSPQWNTGCLTTSRVELLSLFLHAECARRTIALDSLLEHTNEPVTIIDVLNHLLDLRAL